MGLGVKNVGENIGNASKRMIQASTLVNLKNGAKITLSDPNNLIENQPGDRMRESREK